MEHLYSKQIDLFQIRELIFKPLWISLQNCLDEKFRLNMSKVVR